ARGGRARGRAPVGRGGAVGGGGGGVGGGGLGGGGRGPPRRYSEGPNQYTERQQARRARALSRRAWWRRVRDGRGVDVLLTHAPPEGAGDAEDPPHKGFRAVNRLAARLQPPPLLHGHIHPSAAATKDHRVGRTVVRNVVGRHLLDIEPGSGLRNSPSSQAR